MSQERSRGLITNSNSSRARDRYRDKRKCVSASEMHRCDSTIPRPVPYNAPFKRSRCHFRRVLWGKKKKKKISRLGRRDFYEHRDIERTEREIYGRLDIPWQEYEKSAMRFRH
ncbi:hypothetical protein PUN28_013227 [Cardiocondyla obscurior]|uniref:Uncharacterized protein n=1 Tax=Cardiocondyla obscurior TaxID=286306 RepID=A0AAW2F9J4_9HYME